MSYGPYETLRVTGPKDGVLHVELNRPERMNAINSVMWREIRECFHDIASDIDTLVVVISANGRAFTCGLDLKEEMDNAKKASQKPKSDVKVRRRDVGREALQIRRHVMELQGSFNAIEAVPQPVIVVGHGAVIGGGIDMMCACCMRYASKDAFFTIKEVDVGLAADVGTLQRLPKIVGNEGLVRELAYTGRKFDAEEAQRMGFVTRVFGTKDEALAGAMQIAQQMAEKSPLAVAGTKRMITYTRDHTVADGLDYIATWNGAGLQAPDMRVAAAAMFAKTTPKFSKL